MMMVVKILQLTLFLKQVQQLQLVEVVLNGTDANSTDANDDVQLEDASGNIELETEKLQSYKSRKECCII